MLPNWKRKILHFLNEPLYFGMLNLFNVFVFFAAIYIDFAEHTYSRTLEQANFANRLEQILLISSTIIFLLDLIATFMVRDMSEIALHYKMHIVEVILQLISLGLIIDCVKWIH